ncbi:MAG: hypothetical protein SGPRY_013328, partial [Prymnesium sp.]
MAKQLSRFLARAELDLHSVEVLQLGQWLVAGGHAVQPLGRLDRRVQSTREELGRKGV